jgi:hypothetical protein
MDKEKSKRKRILKNEFGTYIFWFYPCKSVCIRGYIVLFSVPPWLI